MIFIILITGIIAGILSGLLGIGGGVIIVPVLSYLYEEGYASLGSGEIMHLAIGTSLASMMFTTAGGVISHLKYGHYAGMNASIYWGLIPGLWVGAWGGNLLNSIASAHLLKIIFMVVAVLVAFRMLWFPHLFFQEAKPHFSRLVFCSIGIVVGGVSSLIGIGGGIFLVPILAYLGLAPYQVSAATSIGTFSSVCMGSIGSIYFGWNSIHGLESTTGYVYWPWAVLIGVTGMLLAPAGVWLSRKLPVKIIRKLFAFILVAVAARMGFNL